MGLSADERISTIGWAVLTQYRIVTKRHFAIAYRTMQSIARVKNKKAQLTLSNPRDVKACKNCSNSTCFVSFHRIPFSRISKF